ncbi:hypothetical protein C8R43DRAFT_955044 [Mycena crocata]|nr:hypothetical protein C8R43DRAFT_955044 [Mycena crocata]
MSIIGGPNPRLGGELSYKVICFGETPAGNDFEQACPDFDTRIEQTFESWLRSCFSIEQRAAAALPVSTEPPQEPRLQRAGPPNVAEPPAKSKKPKRMKRRRRRRRPARRPTLCLSDADPAPLSPLDVPSGANLDSAVANLDLSPGSHLESPANLGLRSEFSSRSPPSAFQFGAQIGTSPGFDPYNESAYGFDDSLKMDGTFSADADGVANDDLFQNLDEWYPVVPPTTLTPAEEVLREPTPQVTDSPVAPAPVVPNRARPSWKGAPATGGAGGSTLPLNNAGAGRRTASAYAPSVLFEAFRRNSTTNVPVTPGRVGKPAGPVTTPPRFTSRQPLSTTKAAQLLKSIIAQPTAPIITAAPVISVINPAAVPNPASVFNPAPAGVAIVLSPSTAPSGSDIPKSPDIPRAPESGRPTSTFPISRPATNTVPVAKPTAAVNKAASKPIAKKTAAKPAATKVAKAKAAKAREGAKAAAADSEGSGGEPTIAPRRRGRPPKNAAPSPLAETTNASDAPALVYSITNNSAAFDKVVEGRRAAVQAAKAAEKAKEHAAEIAAQAKRGWFSTPNPDGNTDIVTLPRARARTAPRMADGSRFTPVVKGSRSRNAHAATETALLERTAGRKRSAADAGDVTGAKKRKKA